jgi:hypothetical protein
MICHIAFTSFQLSSNRVGLKFSGVKLDGLRAAGDRNRRKVASSLVWEQSSLVWERSSLVREASSFVREPSSGAGEQASFAWKMAVFAGFLAEIEDFALRLPMFWTDTDTLAI